MAVDDIYRADYFMLSDDREVSVSIHWRVEEDFVGTPLEIAQSIAEAVEVAFWGAFWQNYASNLILYLRTQVQKIHPARDVIYQSLLLADEVGEKSQMPMNGTTAVLVAEYTNFWSARTRGRIYLPGLPEEDASHGRIHGVRMAEIQAAAELLFQPPLVVAGPPAGELVTVVFSSAKPLQAPPLDATWGGPIRPIVRARIATQRRRRTNVKSPSAAPL